MGECLQTLKICSSLSKIVFDPTDMYLLTDIGPIMLGQPTFALQTVSKSGDIDAVLSAVTVATTATGATAQESQESRQHSYGLSPDGSWITCHGLNVLWLPSEYRPSCCIVSGSTVAIGCQSGRVLVICFLPAVSPMVKWQNFVLCLGKLKE
jgi:hypothetical protein